MGKRSADGAAEAARAAAEAACVVVSIAAGAAKSAAVTASGRLFCWGRDSGKGELGWRIQIGVNMTESFLRPEGMCPGT